MRIEKGVLKQAKGRDESSPGRASLEYRGDTSAHLLFATTSAPDSPIEYVAYILCVLSAMRDRAIPLHNLGIVTKPPPLVLILDNK